MKDTQACHGRTVTCDYTKGDVMVHEENGDKTFFLFSEMRGSQFILSEPGSNSVYLKWGTYRNLQMDINYCRMADDAEKAEYLELKNKSQFK